MHFAPCTVSQLAELAAQLAHRAVPVVALRRLSHVGLPAYWVASQRRIERWNHFLRSASAAHRPPGGISDIDATTTLDWIEEILVSEMVTRVWTALATAHDRHHGGHALEPIARRVYLNHLDVRRQLLTAVVEQYTLDGAAAESVNQTRRRVERWTDLLLGYVMPLADISEFAYSAERVCDHYAAVPPHQSSPTCRPTWQLLHASLRTTFRGYGHTWLPNSELNQRIKLSIIASCGSEPVETRRMSRESWQLRMENCGEDVEHLLQRLLA